jgi:hypothetical protein
MAAEDEVSVANRSTHRTRCSVVTGAATPHRRSRVTPVASVDLGDLAQDGSSAEPNVGVRAISPPRRARNRQDRPTTHFHRRPLDSATEPRMVAATTRLTDRRRSGGGGTRRRPLPGVLEMDRHLVGVARSDEGGLCAGRRLASQRDRGRRYQGGPPLHRGRASSRRDLPPGRQDSSGSDAFGPRGGR